jgi:hypothetical protein
MAYSPPLSSTPMDLANNAANSYDFKCVILIEANSRGLETVKIQASRPQPLAQALTQSLGLPLLRQTLIYFGGQDKQGSSLKKQRLVQGISPYEREL